MPTKTQITSIILVAAAIWGGLLALQGVGLEWNWLRPVSTVTGVVAGLLAVFDRWLWRIPLLHGWLVTVPDIAGTWKAAFQTTYVGPGEETPSRPREAYMSIRQTFSDIRLRLMTQESTSTVIAATISRQPDGTHRLISVYLNEPEVSHRKQSGIHYGCLILEVTARAPSQIRGTYWTDRATAGSLVLTERTNKIVHDHRDAQALYRGKA